MPTLRSRNKQELRAEMRNQDSITARSFQALFAGLNDGAASSLRFDVERFPEHEQVREAVSAALEVMRHAPGVTPWPAIATPYPGVRNAEDILEAAQREGRDVIPARVVYQRTCQSGAERFIRLARVLTEALGPAVDAITRCNCGRWFLALDDRAQACTPKHRPSRRPEEGRKYVKRHRAAK